MQTVGTAVAAPRFLHEVTGGRPEALAVKGQRSNCTAFLSRRRLVFVGA